MKNNLTEKLLLFATATSFILAPLPAFAGPTPAAPPPEKGAQPPQPPAPPKAGSSEVAAAPKTPPTAPPQGTPPAAAPVAAAAGEPKKEGDGGHSPTSGGAPAPQGKGIVFNSPGALPKPFPPDIKKAKGYFVDGSRQFENGEFLGASKDFILSYQYSNNPLLLFNIGKSLQEAGELSEARLFYRFFLTELPDAQNRHEVELELAKIDKNLKEYYGYIEVVGRKNGVYHLSVDNSDRVLCDTPCRIPLKFGDYTIFVKDSSNSSRPYNVKVQKGMQQRIEVFVDPKMPAGEIRLDTEDGAVITDFYTGKIHAGRGEQVLRDVPIGGHEVTVVIPNLIWRGRAIVRQDRTTVISLSTAQMESLSRAENAWKGILAYSALGVGSATLVSGGIMGYFTLQTQRVLNRNTRADFKIRTDLADLGRRQKLATNVLVGVGVTLAVTGLGVLIWSLVETPEVNSDVVFLPK